MEVFIYRPGATEAEKVARVVLHVTMYTIWLVNLGPHAVRWIILGELGLAGAHSGRIIQRMYP